MIDPLIPVLCASALFGVFIVVRFVAATILAPEHPLARAVEAAERPLWRLEPRDQRDLDHPQGEGAACD